MTFNTSRYEQQLEELFKSIAIEEHIAELVQEAKTQRWSRLNTGPMGGFTYCIHYLGLNYELIVRDLPAQS